MTIARRSLLAAPLLLHAAGLRAEGRRIVAIGSAVTEITFALGAGPGVVAVDTTSGFPAAAAVLPRIGYLRALPPEGLIALSPNLLLVSDEAGPPGVIQVLREAGLPLAMIPDGAGGAALSRKIHAVAAGLGVNGTPLAEAVAADWAALDGMAEVPPVAALFVLSVARGAPLVAGRATHADAMLMAAGARNIAAGFSGYRPLSAEAAIAAAPEVIVMMAHVVEEAGGVAEVLRAPALAVTPAGMAGRLVVVDGSYALGFGPRAAHARRDLAAMLHPGLALPTLPERPWLRA
ncbi:iron complex transport system substrate-binding protein [Humitalea rosea]|uniref:Iron complex transport system substrate-binding protein n=1 Tax=Humitalea rosea TaxID=990373 RepID=A0A2W7KFR1_9PROT|nr:ABC transporter substrate-binding protein [Humitalea rosea]PZW46509.1 iron complex transport system substrate-binding protein [Humitalea rosea]